MNLEITLVIDKIYVNQNGQSKLTKCHVIHFNKYINKLTERRIHLGRPMMRLMDN